MFCRLVIYNIALQVGYIEVDCAVLCITATANFIGIVVLTDGQGDRKDILPTCRTGEGGKDDYYGNFQLIEI